MGKHGVYAAPPQGQQQRTRRKDLRESSALPTRRQLRIERELEEAAKARVSRRAQLRVETEPVVLAPVVEVVETTPEVRVVSRRKSARVAAERAARAAQVEVPAVEAPAVEAHVAPAIEEPVVKSEPARELPTSPVAEEAVVPAAELQAAPVVESESAEATLRAVPDAEPEAVEAPEAEATETSAEIVAAEASSPEEGADEPTNRDEVATAVMSLEDIDGALTEGAELSRTERRRRSERTAPAPKKSKQGEHATFGSRQWAFQGIAAGVATLAVVGIPMLLGGGNSASAAQNLTASYVGGEVSTVVDTPASLSADANAPVLSAAKDASAQASSFTCAPQSASGMRAAFAPEVQGAIVMPIREGAYRLTSAFGYRIDPIFGGTSMHAGQDFAADRNTPIYAIADGVVTHAGLGIDGRSNNLIIIQHEIDGVTYYSWYVHMYDDGVLVKEGDTVKAGDTIGLVGSNGNSTGPHLHLEVHDANDELMDPLAFLNDRGAVDISHVCG